MELWRLKFMSLFFAAAFMLVVAIRLNIDQMYLMAGILVSVPFVSYIVGNMALKNITAKRSGPVTCFEGDTVHIQFVIEGKSDLIRNLLCAKDVTPEWVTIESVKPDLDRPGHLTEELIPLRRGDYHLAAVELTASDPLGLFLFRRQLPMASELLVYPLPVEFSEMLLGREARSGQEMRTSLLRRGESAEMHSTREYQPGDELRYIHWRSTARTGRLVVMEREEPTDRTTWIALDLRRQSERGAAPNSSLDTAARLAAAAARDALTEGEAVGLLLPAQDTEVIQPDRGSDHYYSLLHALTQARATSEVSLGETLAHHAAGARARLLFFTATPDPALLQGLSMWILQGGSATGILLDPSSDPGDPEALALADFAAAAEHMGASIHRVSLSLFGDPRSMRYHGEQKQQEGRL